MAAGIGARLRTIMHVHNGSAPLRQPARNCRLVGPSSRIVAGAITPPAVRQPRLVAGDDVRIAGNCLGLEVISRGGFRAARAPSVRPGTSLQPPAHQKVFEDLHPPPGPPATSPEASRSILA